MRRLTTALKGGSSMRGLVLAAAAALVSLPAFAQQGSMLRMGLADDTDIMDPTLSRTYVGRIMFAGLCDKLVDINEKLEIVPQLATSYEWPDSKTLALHLRHGVKFQDGSAMDAEAVKYSLERHLHMEGSMRRGEIASMDHAEVVDPATVRIVLKTPSSPFLAQLTDRSGMIVSPKAAEAEGKDFALHPVCAGPYSFVERVAQDHLTLQRFPDYWDAKDIHIDRVVYRPIPDNSVRTSNIQAGALDMTVQNVPSDLDRLKNDPKLKVSIYNGLGYQGITNNLAFGPKANQPYGQSALVRKAFELAIDRKALIHVVYNDLYTPTAQAIPPASPMYASDIVPPERDIAKAKALLQQAGVKLPVTVNLMVINSPDQVQTGEVIQSMASEAGFDVKIQATEFATSLDMEDRGDFEAYLIGWSGRTDPDGNLWSFIHTGGPFNDSKYSNKDVDTWLDGARLTTDIASRRDLYRKVSSQSNEDLPITYLYVPKFIVAMAKDVNGFVPVPDGLVRLQGMTMSK
jgi:peptide/nickel transport system substrate-binding protein